MEESDPRQKNNAFPLTRWTLVRQAKKGDDSAVRQALEELCHLYWYPVYAHARRCGRNRTDAEDLTQSFFATLLRKGTFTRADEAKGHFRTFLLTAFKQFLIDHQRNAEAQKRGGPDAVRVSPFVIDGDSAETLYHRQTLELGQREHHLTPEALFERRWAVTLLNQAMIRLREEWRIRDKARTFELLEEFIPWNNAVHSTDHIAKQLEIPPPRVRKEIYKLRRRYQALLSQLVSDTLADPTPENVQFEIKELRSIFQ